MLTLPELPAARDAVACALLTAALIASHFDNLLLNHSYGFLSLLLTGFALPQSLVPKSFISSSGRAACLIFPHFCLPETACAFLLSASNLCPELQVLPDDLHVHTAQFVPIYFPF